MSTASQPLVNIVSPVHNVERETDRPETSQDHYRLVMSGAENTVFTRAAVVMFALSAGVFIVARLWRLTAFDLVGDEGFSFDAVRQSWSGMMAMVIHDVVHPPLFYVLLKFWVGVGGYSLLWLKLFPFLFSVAAIVPFLLLCRELRLRAAEINLALVLMAVNGFLIFHAQNLRMYTL